MEKILDASNFVMAGRVLDCLEGLEEPQDIRALFELEKDHGLPLNLANHWQAFIHVSFVREFKGKIESNERPEFLGDTVLNLLVTEKLFAQYPESDEGRLSKLRASLVNEEGLYELACASRLYRLIVLGRGAMGNNKNRGLVADLLEAVLGSVYLEGGLESARTLLGFFLDTYERKTNRPYMDPKKLESFDPKSLLQERVLALHGLLPQYTATLLGPQYYRVSLVIGDRNILTEKGNSKRGLEKKLAKRALENRLYR